MSQSAGLLELLRAMFYEASRQSQARRHAEMRLNDAADVSDECFVQIFQRLDTATLCNCLLTCHRFNNLISNDAFWVELARTRAISDVLPSLEWRRAVNTKRFAENGAGGELDVSTVKFDLKRMVLTEKGFGAMEPEYIWEFERAETFDVRGTRHSHDFHVAAAGDGIRLERPGAGCNAHPEVSQCLAFSYTNSSLYMYVDLVAAGIEPWILDHVRPKIRVTQKVNHRHDCSAELRVAAQLNYLPQQWKTDNVTEEQQAAPSVDKKRLKSIRKQWEQWTLADWEDVTLEFTDYPSGMRHVTVRNTGRDLKYWGGFYGPKVANTVVQVIMPDVPILKALQADTERTGQDDPPHEEENELYYRGHYQRSMYALLPARYHRNPQEE